MEIGNSHFNKVITEGSGPGTIKFKIKSQPRHHVGMNDNSKCYKIHFLPLIIFQIHLFVFL